MTFWDNYERLMQLLLRKSGTKTSLTYTGASGEFGVDQVWCGLSIVNCARAGQLRRPQLLSLQSFRDRSYHLAHFNECHCKWVLLDIDLDSSLNVNLSYQWCIHDSIFQSTGLLEYWSFDADISLIHFLCVWCRRSTTWGSFCFEGKPVDAWCLRQLVQMRGDVRSKAMCTSTPGTRCAYCSYFFICRPIAYVRAYVPVRFCLQRFYLKRPNSRSNLLLCIRKTWTTSS